MNLQEIMRTAESFQSEIVNFLLEFCAIPAVNPSFGGTGEFKRAVWLADYLNNQGIPVEIKEVPDEAVPEGRRLNLIAYISGREASAPTLWLVAHLDTVAPGDKSSWASDPFTPVVKGERIYGRGVEDNGQAVACITFAVKMLKQLGLVPERKVGLLFVSDEEAGSDKGLKHLVREGLFKPGDEALVPDSGTPDGGFLEIAEKSILWCKFNVQGKECHASNPLAGINAGWIGSLLAVDMIKFLRGKYCHRDALFNPPFSTFELTQKFGNVGSPNVIPGEDVFVVDFRVLPSIGLAEIIEDIERLLSKYEYEYGVRIKYETLQRLDAPKPTPVAAPIVKKLSGILKEFGVSSRIGGIGGGTCAAFLREAGIPAVVWSTIEETAHQPNEYVVIDNLVKDTAIMLALMMAQNGA
ncbi:M20 family metallo-hydrolase [Thermacetogenium phaeum]|nr:M20 family metallo-hydrolase [Thermacetogenium phaeum]